MGKPFLGSHLLVGIRRDCRAGRARTHRATTYAVKPVTEDYFGTKVVDPCRYFEDLKNPEVVAQMKAQADYTRAVLG